MTVTARPVGDLEPIETASPDELRSLQQGITRSGVSNSRPGLTVR
jgi:hypothetical protein